MAASCFRNSITSDSSGNSSSRWNGNVSFPLFPAAHPQHQTQSNDATNCFNTVTSKHLWNGDVMAKRRQCSNSQVTEPLIARTTDTRNYVSRNECDGELGGTSAKSRKKKTKQKEGRKAPKNEASANGQNNDVVAARELTNLTPTERHRLFEDIHGVVESTTQEDDIEFVNRCLEEMDDEIQKVRHRAAYNKAHFLSPKYVTSKFFRLMFLRATSFDPRAAGRRIVAHFENKAVLFGEDMVAKKIAFSDLTKDDKAVLLSGYAQFLPQPDSAGRTVSFLVRKRQHVGKSWKNAFRASWYRAMVALESDENLQRLGCVCVYYDIGGTNSCGSDGTMNFDNSNHSRISRDQVMNMHLLRDALPLKLTAFHFCYDHVALQPAMSLLRTVAGTQFRLRFRDHFGSHQECQYSLMTFGIAKESLPLNEHGELVNDQFLEALRIQKQKEENLEHFQRLEIGPTSKDAGLVIEATDNDCLLGKGWPCQHHPGNLKLAALIEHRREQHNCADKFEKVCISMDVVNIIQKQLGGRFLEMDENIGTWSVSVEYPSVKFVVNFA